MAKFVVKDINDDTAPRKPAMDEVRDINGLPPMPKPATQNPNVAVQPIPVMMVSETPHDEVVEQEAIAVEAEAKVEEKVVDQQINKEEEHWMKSYWRPAMAWLWMAICACDFIVFPVMYHPWVSLTLSNGGIIHAAFAAVVGVSAWSRGQEKLAKLN